MTELLEKYIFDELEKAEIPDYMFEIDTEHTCEHCGGQLLVGEYEAAGICSDCYWVALETTDGV